MHTYDLIHVHPAAKRGTASFLFMPAGVFGLLNECRAAGFEVAALNEPLEISLDRSFSIGTFLRTHAARVFSIDLHWHEHTYGAIEVARAVKAAHPRAAVVLGGMTASLYAESLLARHREIDAVIAGYGEGQLPELLREGALTQRRIIAGKQIPDLNAQEYIARDFLLHHNEYLHCSIHACTPGQQGTTFWLKNGQGCASECSYCGGGRSAQKMIFGNGVLLHRTPERIARDICALDAQGVSMISLTQDPALAGRPHWSAVNANVRAAKRRPGVYFEANGLPSDDFIREFAATFDLQRSAVVLTPLCSDQSVRRRNGKRFSNEQLHHCLESCYRAGLRTALYFTAGLPFSQALNSANEAQFRSEIQKRFDPLFVFETTLTLDPASGMQRYPERYGVEPRLCSCDDYVARTRARWHGLPYDSLGYSVLPAEKIAKGAMQ